ncbi:hypothetical protein GN956_G8268 [Arapaima gigas]
MKVRISAPFGLCLLLAAPPLFASAGVVHLKRSKGDPVNFFCESHDRAAPPIGFYLKLKSPQPEKEMMFLAPKSQAVHNSEFEGRVHTLADLNQHRVNITVLSLQESDSGFYVCEFMYNSTPHDKTVMGSPSYFLFVEEGEPECNCSLYSLLLYAISAVTAVFLLIATALAVALCCKVCRHERPQNPLPIYEEMTGLKPKREKGPLGALDSLHLEETNFSVSDKPRCRLSQENYYVSPKRATCTSEEGSPQGLLG